MVVDIESLSTDDWLTLLRYAGDLPEAAEFDHLRMTPQEWDALFAGDAEPAPAEEVAIDDGAAASPAAGDSADAPAED